MPLSPRRQWRPTRKTSSDEETTVAVPDIVPVATPRMTRPIPERVEPKRAPDGLLRGEPLPPRTPPPAPHTAAEEGVALAYQVLDRFLEEGRRYAEGQSAWYGDDPEGSPDVLREAVRGGADLIGFLSRLGRELARLAPAVAAAVPPMAQVHPARVAEATEPASAPPAVRPFGAVSSELGAVDPSEVPPLVDEPGQAMPSDTVTHNPIPMPSAVFASEYVEGGPVAAPAHESLVTNDGPTAGAAKPPDEGSINPGSIPKMSRFDDEDPYASWNAELSPQDVDVARELVPPLAGPMNPIR